MHGLPASWLTGIEKVAAAPVARPAAARRTGEECPDLRAPTVGPSLNSLLMDNRRVDGAHPDPLVDWGQTGEKGECKAAVNERREPALRP